MPRAKKVLSIEEMVEKIQGLVNDLAKQALQWRYVRESAASGASFGLAKKTLVSPKPEKKSAKARNPVSDLKPLPPGENGKEET